MHGYQLNCRTCGVMHSATSVLTDKELITSQAKAVNNTEIAVSLQSCFVSLAKKGS